MLYYKLKKRTLKDSKINLISSKEEDQNKPKSINIKLIKPITNSERKKLTTRSIEIDINSNKEEVKEENPLRNIEKKKKEDNTTLYSNQIMQLNIQIDNENNER